MNKSNVVSKRKYETLGKLHDSLIAEHKDHLELTDKFFWDVVNLFGLDFEEEMDNGDNPCWEDLLSKLREDKTNTEHLALQNLGKINGLKTALEIVSKAR